MAQRRTIRGLLLAALICLLHAFLETAEAQETDRLKVRTKVAIAFDMRDPRYTDEFRDEGLPLLKEAAGRAIAGALEDKIRFLEFVAESRPDYILTVRLDRAEGSRAEGPAEFGLHFALSGPEVREEAKSYLVFRTKDQYLSPIGDQASLVKELELAVAGADHGKLVSEVLRNVAISDAADVNPQPLGWLVPRDRAHFCIDRDSRLLVVNALPSNFGIVHAPLEARVLDVTRPDGIIVSMADTSVLPELIEQLKAKDPSQVQVESVFIMEYRRFCPPQAVPPSQADFSQEMP
jgi:hypothetical protein